MTPTPSPGAGSADWLATILRRNITVDYLKHHCSGAVVTNADTVARAVLAAIRERLVSDEAVTAAMWAAGNAAFDAPEDQHAITRAALAAAVGKAMGDA